MRDLQAARTRLEQGDVTLVLCRAEVLLPDTRRGVAPLLALLDAKNDYSGFCAADKVVGAGAAFLYELLAVRAVYADVISERAVEILKRAGIPLQYGACVPYVRNRAGDGRCPIEKAVLPFQTASEALLAIRQALAELRGK